METGINIGPYRRLYGEKSNLIGEVTLYKYMPGYRWTHQDDIKNALKIEDILKNCKFTKEQIQNIKLYSELTRHWVPGYSLLTESEVYVPILLTKWLSSTNGLASGNTIEEAIIHGACEIFERDALIKFLRRLNINEVPEINKPSIKDEEVQSMMSFMEEKGIDVNIKYIGDAIYPVYAIITTNRNLEKNCIGYNAIKAGSSFSAIDAVKRCFTERMQGTSFDAEEKEGLSTQEQIDDEFLPIFFKGVCPIDLSYLKNGRGADFNDYKVITGTKTEIENCKDIAKKLGTDIIVIDHTHPVIGFPTARVIMPGISDFMRWWDQKKVTMEFIGNINLIEDAYEDTLMEILKSFNANKPLAGSAQNNNRRDT